MTCQTVTTIFGCSDKTRVHYTAADTKSGTATTEGVPLYQTTDNGLRHIQWDAKLLKYCRNTRVSTKHMLALPEPQLDSSSVVKLTRYTLSLVDNPKYTRQISWLDSAGDNVAVVEYIGEQSSVLHMVGASSRPQNQRTFARHMRPYNRLLRSASLCQ